jgi:hypothetical protein
MVVRPMPMMIVVNCRAVDGKREKDEDETALVK